MPQTPHPCQQELGRDPVIARIAAAREVAWINPLAQPFELARDHLAETFGLSADDISDAEARLARFAPFIEKRFPQTRKTRGVIESPLVEIGAMRRLLNEGGAGLVGRLLLKCDSDLAIAGSVKARGGIYEVLKRAEGLALENGLLDGPDDDYAKLAGDEARRFFSKYKMQVGSTGNLGLSIGITGAAVGFATTVHMSADAKRWKKDMLRARGATVVEYAGDYGEAVANGRAASDADPASYFVDDENSRDLFLGYAVAARRLRGQLDALGVAVGAASPLFVYIPCGVGGAPGGIAFGLKHEFGDDVHVFFVEPVQAPCMLLGMASGLHSRVCVGDVGLSGATHADGLAVGRPSGFVGRVMEPLLAGEFTVGDPALYDYLRMLDAGEGMFVEPSSCAAFAGPDRLMREPETRGYLRAHGLLGPDDVPTPGLAGATHVAWATGGSLVPPAMREEMLATRLA